MVSPYGAEKAYTLGYMHGFEKALPVAHDLLVSIMRQLSEDDEVESARKKTKASTK